MNGEKRIWKPGEQPDEHHGLGGSYTVDGDGKRRLVDGSRTDFSAEVIVDPATGERTPAERDPETGELRAKAGKPAAQPKE